jgi:maltooligosyltrehalose trehalohydrolase
LKLAAGTVLLSPYIPLLFMGEEYSESARFQYFVSHGDAALIEAVRKGRKNEFAEFGWSGDIPDPQSEATFLSSKLNWNLQSESQHRILWNFYRELLRLRREVSPLASLDKDTLEVKSFAEQRALVARRWDASSEVLILCSFNQAPTDVNAQVPAGDWRTILDSDDERWGGKGGERMAAFHSDGQIQFRLSPWTFLVLGQD